MPRKPKSPPAGKVPCPTCGGRGVRSWATEDLPCSACKGTGWVKAP